MAHDNVSKSGDRLSRDLPSFMPNDRSSNNYHLLEAIGHAIDSLEEDIELVDGATSPHTAKTVDQLFELAKLVDVNPKSNDSTDQYRPRVLTRYSLMTGEGTIQDLLGSISLILNTSIESLKYTEDFENGVAVVNIPQTALDGIDLSTQEINQIINETVFAGYRVQINTRGTFTYITSDEYEDAAFSHDSDLGYDGLDGAGEPKGNGGTYSGIL